jgi:hypothetical protein
MRSSGSFGKPCQKNGKPSEARCQTTSGSSLTTNFGFWGENSIMTYCTYLILLKAMNGQKIINPGHTKLTLLQDGQSASRSIALRNRRFASYLLLSSHSHALRTQYRVGNSLWNAFCKTEAKASSLACRNSVGTRLVPPSTIRFSAKSAYSLSAANGRASPVDIA